MGSFIRILRPMAYVRRKAIYGGLLGGNRKWLILGGAAWMLRSGSSLFGKGHPSPVHVEDLPPGERFVIVHTPTDRKGRARRRA